MTLLHLDKNLNIAGRNLAAQKARGELLLMLDDDSYPLPGAVEALRWAFEALPASARRAASCATSTRTARCCSSASWARSTGSSAPGAKASLGRRAGPPSSSPRARA